MSRGNWEALRCREASIELWPGTALSEPWSPLLYDGPPSGMWEDSFRTNLGSAESQEHPLVAGVWREGGGSGWGCPAPHPWYLEVSGEGGLGFLELSVGVREEALSQETLRDSSRKASFGGEGDSEGFPMSWCSVCPSSAEDRR